MGGPDMAPQPPQTFGAPGMNPGAPLSPSPQRSSRPGEAVARLDLQRSGRPGEAVDLDTPTGSLPAPGQRPSGLDTAAATQFHGADRGGSDALGSRALDHRLPHGWHRDAAAHDRPRAPAGRHHRGEAPVVPGAPRSPPDRALLGASRSSW